MIIGIGFRLATANRVRRSAHTEPGNLVYEKADSPLVRGDSPRATCDWSVRCGRIVAERACGDAATVPCAVSGCVSGFKTAGSRQRRGDDLRGVVALSVAVPVAPIALAALPHHRTFRDSRRPQRDFARLVHEWILLDALDDELALRDIYEPSRNRVLRRCLNHERLHLPLPATQREDCRRSVACVAIEFRFDVAVFVRPLDRPRLR